MPERAPDPDDLKQALMMLRRVAKRLNIVENRLAGLEEQVHWLEDLPEQLQAIRKLTSRITSADDSHLDDLVRQAVTKEMNGRIQSQVVNAVDKQLRKRLGG